MAFYRLKLSANKPYMQETPGALILIDEVDGADSVDITLVSNNGARTRIPDRKAAFKYIEKFDGVIFEASADCFVSVFLSFNDVSLGFSAGAEVLVAGEVSITNDAGSAIPVSVQGGVINMTATNVGVNNDLKTITDFPAVAVGTGVTPLVNDATQKRLRIRNAHASAKIAIGGAGVTLANGAVHLLPGDVWMEDDAPGAAWYAISDTAAASVQIQGVK